MPWWNEQIERKQRDAMRAKATRKPGRIIKRDTGLDPEWWSEPGISFGSVAPLARWDARPSSDYGYTYIPIYYRTIDRAAYDNAHRMHSVFSSNQSIGGMIWGPASSYPDRGQVWREGSAWLFSRVPFPETPLEYRFK